MFPVNTPPKVMVLVDLVSPLLNVRGDSNDVTAVEARFILPLLSTESTGIMVDEPYVPEVTVVLARVNTPVDESVASPERDTNVLKLKTIMAIAVMSLNTVNAANWFVKGDGNANTTGGTSWATAVTLSKALTSAVAGDVIYLSAGTYTQTAYVTIGKAYTVIGGFAGTENESSISISMSNPAVNVTKLTQAASSTIFKIGTLEFFCKSS